MHKLRGIHQFVFCAVSASVLLLCGSNVFAQGWAEKMFGERTHNFGVVARGAVVEHRFKVENIYLEDMHIVAVRSSCGCTAVKVANPTLKTYDETEIIASLDTRNFLGRKDATLTVVFDAPFEAEVQLHIHSFIRGDVVLQPGIVEFGSVSEGRSVKKQVNVTYAGRPNWKIIDVESANPQIEAGVRELGRQFGQVSYELTVALKDDTPVGYIKDHIILVTNDSNGDRSRVIVSVAGRVTRAIQVRPSLLNLGIVESGKSVTKHLVLQGDKPFRVLGFDCDEAQFKFKVPKDAKTLHVIPVTFVGEDKVGAVAADVSIKTDLGNTSVVAVKVRAQVVDDKPNESEWHTPAASKTKNRSGVGGPRHF